jgi:caffeoyl-CoA O-methyltransferase
MASKFLSVDQNLYDYLARHRSDAGDPLLLELRSETLALGDVSKCQISDEQGTFLTILTAAIGARTALEVGTFTGYSAVCIARGLGPSGKLVCLDQNAEWTAIAKRYWNRAGLSERIELRLGPAIPSIRALSPQQTFDLVFIDAEKTEYDAYYELVLPHVRQNGLILFDNMLWGGGLGSGQVEEASGRAIDALNQKLAKDPRVEAVLIPIADGIQLCRKR